MTAKTAGRKVLTTKDQLANRSNTNLSDCVSLVLMAASLFLLTCLLSYDPKDPSFNVATTRAGVSNLCGLLGAYIADGLVQLLGKTALLLPFILGAFAFRKFRFPERAVKGRSWVAALLGLMMLACVAESFAARPFLGFPATNSGGAVGGSLHFILSRLLGGVGEFLFTLTGLAVCALILADAPLKGVLADMRLKIRRFRSGRSTLAASFFSFFRKDRTGITEQPRSSAPTHEETALMREHAPLPEIEPVPAIVKRPTWERMDLTSNEYTLMDTAPAPSAAPIDLHCDAASHICEADSRAFQEIAPPRPWDERLLTEVDAPEDRRVPAEMVAHASASFPDEAAYVDPIDIELEVVWHESVPAQSAVDREEITPKAPEPTDMWIPAVTPAVVNQSQAPPKAIHPDLAIEPVFEDELPVDDVAVHAPERTEAPVAAQLPGESVQAAKPPVAVKTAPVAPSVSPVDIAPKVFPKAIHPDLAIEPVFEDELPVDDVAVHAPERTEAPVAAQLPGEGVQAARPLAAVKTAPVAPPVSPVDIATKAVPEAIHPDLAIEPVFEDELPVADLAVQAPEPTEAPVVAELPREGVQAAKPLVLKITPVTAAEIMLVDELPAEVTLADEDDDTEPPWETAEAAPQESENDALAEAKAPFEEFLSDLESRGESAEVQAHIPPEVAQTPETKAGGHVIKVVRRADERKLHVVTAEEKPHETPDYRLPSLDLLDTPPDTKRTVDEEFLQQNAAILEQKLSDLGVKASVVEIHPGPVITMYEVTLAPGIPLRRVLNMADDLAMALKSGSTRIVAPIPGKDTVGIEVPNLHREIVYFSEIVESDVFRAADLPLKMALGKCIDGEPFSASLTGMPHLLIAGATGTGKSVGLNCLILSWLMSCSPDEVKFLMVDPKRLELSYYQDIPHLLHPVVTEAEKVPRLLSWAIKEMERRYELLSEAGAKNIQGFNRMVEKDELRTGDNKPLAKIPYIIIIVDELAELMMVSAKDIEIAIARLAQMARAAGIHLILATQRPSVDVVTGIIKANFPARLSFQVSAKADSRTILDGVGAENLLGMGDMLFLPPGVSKVRRLHGAYVSENEIRRVVDFIKAQRRPTYLQEITTHVTEEDARSSSTDLIDDVKYDEAVELVTRLGHASISLIQRHMRIGYNRAARIIEAMESEGIIGPSDGTSRPREVLARSLEAVADH